MKIDIKIPAMGESISEAILSEWVKADGDYVKRNENVLVLESDKANFDIQADKAGQLSISIGSCFLYQLLNLCTSISQLRYFFVVPMHRICLAILQLGHFKLFFFENIFKLFILHINSSRYHIFLLLKGVVLFIQCFGLS